MSDSRSVVGTARRDAVISGVLVLAAFALASGFDFHERWDAFTAAHEAWEIDEIPLAFALTTFAFAVFAFRRWREARHQGARSVALNARLRVEIAAREESEHRFQDFAEAGSDWFWEMDAELRFSWFSANIEQALGVEAAKLVGRSRHELKDAGNPPEQWRAHLDTLARRQPFRDFTYQVANAEFGQVWVQISGVPVFDTDGVFTGYRGVGRNLTDLKQAEAALRQREAEATTSRRLLVDAINAMTDGFAMYDANDRLVLCNQKYKEMYAESAAAMIPGARFESILRYGLERGQYADAIGREEAWLAERMRVHRTGRQSIEQQLANGRWLLINERRTEDGGYVGVRTDLTELKKRDEQLGRMQRLDAIGKMTGGIAHDFNNLLAIVIGNFQLLQREPGQSDAAKRFLQDGLDAALRGAELTQRMLAFGRRQLLQPKAVDINVLVSGIDALMRRTIGPMIAVETRLAADLPTVLIDPGQFENALLNLALNARDAMPRGGRLMIETADVELTKSDLVGADDVDPGAYVMLAVTDTGSGMPSAVIEHVFEPFFTTKETGKGTGLGLSMVYGFVRQSQGHISIDSEVGRGTTVRLYCPHNHTLNASISDRLDTASGPNVEGGSETVLVVDDEEAVRRTALNMLKQLGYATVEASNGQEALTLLQARPDIDLLLTDVIMPGGMSGIDLAQAAKRRDLAVLLTSGYSDESFSYGDVAISDVAWLPKPFLTPQLAQKVRQALDRRPDRAGPFSENGVGDAG